MLHFWYRKFTDHRGREREISLKVGDRPHTLLLAVKKLKEVEDLIAGTVTEEKLEAREAFKIDSLVKTF